MHVGYTALVLNVLLHLISNDSQDNCKLTLAKWKKNLWTPMKIPTIL